MKILSFFQIKNKQFGQLIEHQGEKALLKYASRDRHFFREAKAWAVDVNVLSQARNAGAEGVLLFIKGEKPLFASFEVFDRHGFKLDLRYGEQIFLAEKHWQPWLPPAGRMALKYLELGLAPVLLHGLVNSRCTCGNENCVKSAGKHPVFSGWQNAPIPTVKEIQDWFTHHPWANLGIRTGHASGVFVLDVDSLHVLKELPELPVTWQTYTGNGTHFYFRLPEGVKIGNQVRVGGLQLDIRSDGGLVVAPPSKHISGKLYRWAPGKTLWECELADPPRWLLEKIIQPEKININTARRPAAPPPVPEENWQKAVELLAAAWPAPGQRQDAALALSGGLARAGWSQEQIERFIADVAAAAGDEETAMRVKTAAYSLRKTGVQPTTGWKRLAEIIGTEVVEQVKELLGVQAVKNTESTQSAVVSFAGIKLNPEALTSLDPPRFAAYPPGFLEEFVEYCAQYSDVEKDFLFAAALQVVSMVIGRNVRLRFGRKWLYPLLWQIILAGSGMRKSTALYNAKDFLRLAGLEDVISPDSTTQESFLESLTIQPTQLLIQDEAAAFFASLKKTYMASTREMLLSLFDCPETYVRQRKDAGGKIRRFVVREPFVGFFAASTVETFCEYLTETDAVGGLLPRILFVIANKPTRPPLAYPPEEKEPPNDLVTILGNLRQARGELRIQEGTETFKIYRDFFDELYAEKTKPDTPGVLSSFVDRLVIYSLVLAMIIESVWAAEAGAEIVEEVSPEAMSWGVELARIYFQSAKWLLERETAFSEYEKNRKKVLSILQRNNGQAPQWLIYRRAKLPAKVLQDVLETMVKARELTCIENKRDAAGRPTRWYLLAELIQKTSFPDTEILTS